VAKASSRGKVGNRLVARQTGGVNVPGPCIVEVHPDGGIRLTTPSGQQGLASLRTTRDWIAQANRADAPVRLCGSLGASSAVPVVDEVRRLATSLEEQQTDPAPWAHRHSSVQTAAFSGLTEQLSDLLDRGASPNIGRWGSTPYRLAHGSSGGSPSRSSCWP
jgi:hypothetical protein